VKLCCRRHNDFKKRFPPTADALAELKHPATCDVAKAISAERKARLGTSQLRHNGNRNDRIYKSVNPGLCGSHHMSSLPQSPALSALWPAVK
jgi:hypothetical protein